MAHTTLEEMIAVARTLPPEDQRRLRQWLEEQERQMARQEPQAVAADQTANRRGMELRWLEEHEADYAGQWLALDGDRLLACGADAKQVYAAAGAAGVHVPFVVLAEDPQKPQWGGWR